MEQTEQKDQNQVHAHALEIKKKLEQNPNRLVLARVSLQTKADFIALADEEFCGDYGMTLKWLMDGIIGKDVQVILTEMEAVKARIIALENKVMLGSSEEKPKTIRMMNGRQIGSGMNKVNL